MLELNTAETVIDHGLSLGADVADVFVERRLTRAGNTLRSQGQAVEAGIEFGMGRRLVVGAQGIDGHPNNTAAEHLQHLFARPGLALGWAHLDDDVLPSAVVASEADVGACDKRRIDK